ncbi:MAG TPA: class I SAM-dependent methyltransferase [archaeon]|nr:class I SAM-dependent methyltransferase [archaeon]
MSENTGKTSVINETTVSSYSLNCANVYDDPSNINFVYGQLTTEFLKEIIFKPEDKTVLDIGCGTGLAFDVLKDKFESLDMKGIGIDPAEGMLKLGIKKFKGNQRFTFLQGSFENSPVEDKSIDHVISTLALHWATSLEKAVKEMYRLLKPGGSIDILMIAKDDGARFKLPVVEAMKKHLSFAQILKAASLAIRVDANQLRTAFEEHYGDNYIIEVRNPKKIIYGSFEEHMKWWTARSSAIIADVQDKDSFFRDLKEEFTKIKDAKGIPFDLSCLFLSVKQEA